MEKLYEIFWQDLSVRFPEGFNNIHGIADLEKQGYRLKEIYDIGGDTYLPNELQRFMKEYILPWGHDDTTEMESKKGVEVRLLFEKEGKRYLLTTSMILDGRTLKLASYDPVEEKKHTLRA